MNVKLRVLSIGVLFFAGQQATAQRVKRDTATKTTEIAEVVLVGGIKLDPAQKVGSYNVVSKASFESTPFSTIDEVLNGRVAGLNFSSASGDPGSSNMMLIRGVSSLIGTPNPLYVIDGIIVGKGADNAQMMESWNPLAVIDPNSIESVSVLKDASATALYGSRGANGVIIVKTKRGKYNQKTRFEFSTETGIQSKAYDKLRLMTGDEYIKYGGILMWNSQDGNGLPVGTTFTTLQEATQYYLDNYIPNDEPIKYSRNYTNWDKLINRNSSMVTTYNFGVTGGGDNTSYRIGSSYYENSPLVRSSDFDRLSASLSLDHKASDKLKFNVNANYSNVKRNTYMGGRASANPITSAIMLSPLRSVYNEDGTFNQDAWQNTSETNAHYTPQGETDMSQYFNPISIFANTYQVSTINTFLASASMDYEFVKNWYFNSLFGTQSQVMRELQVIDKGHPIYTAQLDPENYGFMQDARTTIFDYNWSNTFSFRKNFNSRHNVEAFLGMEYQDHTYNVINALSFYMTDKRPYFRFAKEGTILADGDDYRWRQIAYFSRLNYTLDGKYTLTGQLRRDGNSTLGEQKWGNFWSIGGSWNMGNESWKPDFFSSATLRASYGVLGNIPYADQWGFQYNAQPLLGYGSGYSWGSENGYGGISLAGNPSLTWEEAKHLDVGFDFGILNDRIKFQLDYYDKITDKAIDQSFPAVETGGPTSFYGNIGTISNRGFELVIDAVPVMTESFRWSINANGSYGKTYLDKYNLPLKQFGQDTSDANNAFAALAPGHLFGEYYTRIWAGIAQADDPTKNIRRGDALFYTDETRTDVTNKRLDAKEVWMGKSAFPTYNVAMTNEFKYKNISLSVLLSGQFDFLVHNGVHSYTIHDGRFPVRNQISDALYDSWTDAPGAENFNASNPRATIGDPLTWRLESSRFVNKGDHIRLKELRLAYSFGNLFKESTGLNNLTIYLRGTNLFTYTFDRDLNYDPESNSNAWSWVGKGRYWYASPVMKSMSMGIQIGF